MLIRKHSLCTSKKIRLKYFKKSVKLLYFLFCSSGTPLCALSRSSSWPNLRPTWRSWSLWCERPCSSSSRRRPSKLCRIKPTTRWSNWRRTASCAGSILGSGVSTGLSTDVTRQSQFHPPFVRYNNGKLDLKTEQTRFWERMFLLFTRLTSMQWSVVTYQKVLFFLVLLCWALL